jgi:predicted AAA+ superfamily ATPase
MNLIESNAWDKTPINRIALSTKSSISKIMPNMNKLFDRLNELLDRVEHIVPEKVELTVEARCRAYRWMLNGLEGIPIFDQVEKSTLLHIDRQKNLMSKNTTQFLYGEPANNALLWGARGTGKSSLIKSLLTEFDDSDLCMVEIPKSATGEIFEIIRKLSTDSRKFIIYLDDLSFESNDDSYKAVKACLDGSLQPQPNNVLIYATSNRQHLMPESMKDNLDSGMVGGQIHIGHDTEEKASLSDRFGLWLSFHPFTQDQYLAIVDQTLTCRNLEITNDSHAEALKFATSRGSRSGRIAFQFAAYWASLMIEVDNS